MQTLPLGQTGLNISELVFGGAAVGQQYGPVSEREVSDALYCAAEAGMNLIDTSAFYGLGRSEEIFGTILTPELRKQFGICTKAGRLDRDRFDFSAAGMRECFEGSLKRLKTDSVDILLAHDIEFADDFEQVFHETANVLHQLKKEGRCRFIGMSGLPLGLLKQAVECCQLDVIISYCHFNLQDQSLLNELWPSCQKHGVGVMNASPLAMGLLTKQGPPPWHPASDKIKAACARAAEFCEANSTDISLLGMQFCLNQKLFPTITGAAKRNEIERNLKACHQAPDPMLLEKVFEILKPVHNETWPSGNY